MKWIDRLENVRQELTKALEEAESPDQKAATRSLLTSVEAWRYTESKRAKLKKDESV